MDWYPLVLFAHLLGAVGLFMALAVELASVLGARRADTIEAVRAWSRVGKPLSIVFPVSSLLILGAGLVLTAGVWGWSHAWIDLSLALSVLLSLVGARVNGAHAKRIAERAATPGHGPIPSDLRQALSDPLHGTSVISMTMLALGIVFLMVEKPDWLGSVITLCIALLLGIILARVLVRSAGAPVSAPDGQNTAERTTMLPTK